MKCANCSESALYQYRITQGTSVFYCSKHLPSFLEGRKRAGLLAITEEHSTQQEEALNILSSLETVETPKPVKKTTKKSAK